MYAALVLAGHRIIGTVVATFWRVILLLVAILCSKSLGLVAENVTTATMPRARAARSLDKSLGSIPFFARVITIPYFYFYFIGGK